MNKSFEVITGSQDQNTPDSGESANNGETLRGIYKLSEEMCELGAVLAKFGPFPDGRHPSPEYNEKYTLHDHMLEEVADVRAALTYFMQVNNFVMDETRYHEKLLQFHKWGMTGLRP